MSPAPCLWCGRLTNNAYCYVCENRQRVATEQRKQTRILDEQLTIERRQESYTLDDFGLIGWLIKQARCKNGK